MRKAVLALGTGVMAGFASGLLGIGGGLVMVPLLVGLLSFSQHHAHATSLAAIVLIAGGGAAVFGVAGEIDVAAALFLIPGAAVGAAAGARLMARTSEARLKVAFGVFMVIVGTALVIA